MDRFPQIKPDPPESRNPHQDTGGTGHIRPLDSTGSRSLNSDKYLVSAGAGKDKQPRPSTFLNFFPSYGDASAEASGTGGDRVRPKNVIKWASSGGQLAPLEVYERPRTTAAGDPFNPDPVRLNPTSSRLKDYCSNISFTIPPTEEDLRRMQPSRGKDGHIKRPMNAFMVWSNIHRHALWKNCPNASMTDTSVLLGSEWSKLNQEQQRPYFEAAQKLKYLHEQQFPDYKFCPKRKMFRECLYSGGAAGQEVAHGAGQEAGHGAGQEAGHGAGQEAGHGAGQEAGHGAAQGAGHVTLHGARQVGHVAGQEAGHGAGHVAGREAGQEAAQGAGLGAGQVAGQASGQGPEQAVVQGAGQAAVQGAAQTAGQAAEHRARQAAGQGAGQIAEHRARQAAGQGAGQVAEHRARQAAGQGAGQVAGQNSGVSFIASQTVPPPQPGVFGPSTYPYQVMMPCRLGYLPHPSSCWCQPMCLCSRVKINHSRFFYGHENASSSTEGARSDHTSHLWWDEAALTREHHLAHISHQVTTFTASTTTSGSFEQPAVASGQQLSANYTVAYNYEDEVDVVGLV